MFDIEATDVSECLLNDFGPAMAINFYFQCIF